MRKDFLTNDSAWIYASCNFKALRHLTEITAIITNNDSRVSFCSRSFTKFLLTRQKKKQPSPKWGWSTENPRKSGSPAPSTPVFSSLLFREGFRTRNTSRSQREPSSRRRWDSRRHRFDDISACFLFDFYCNVFLCNSQIERPYFYSLLAK